MRRGFCPAGFFPAAGNRRWAFSLPGKIEAQRGRAPGTSRGRARRGEEKDTVRDLPGAAARIAHRRCARRRRGLFPCPGKQEPGVGHAHGTSRGRARRGEGKDRVRELPAAGAGFFPARENRSSAWAHTWKQPRACAAGCRHKPGARLAHRRCFLGKTVDRILFRAYNLS